MKRFIATLLASVSFSATVLAQSQQSPTPMLQTSPLAAGGGQQLVLPFTNGGEIAGQFNTSSPELVEGFDTTTLNIVNNWLAPTTGGGGNAVAATSQAAQTILSSGLTAGGWSKLQSIKVFTEDNPGYQFFQTNVNITPVLGGVAGGGAATTGNCMFMGFGTVPANPVCGAMATNAAGFETTSTGAMHAVTYASGTRLLISDLSVVRGAQQVTTQFAGGGTSGQPIAVAYGCRCIPQAAFNGNGNSHKLTMYMRGDNIVFATENSLGQQFPVAATLSGAAGLDVNAVPATFVAVATSGAATAGLLQINQVTIARTSGRAISLPPVVNATSGTALVLKSYPGALVSAYATNIGATAGVIMLLNATVAPTSGAAVSPIECIPIAAAGATTGVTSNGVNYRPGPYKHFNTGIVELLSTGSTCGTYTIGAVTGFLSGDVQ